MYYCKMNSGVDIFAVSTQMIHRKELEELEDKDGYWNPVDATCLAISMIG